MRVRPRCWLLTAKRGVAQARTASIARIFRSSRTSRPACERYTQFTIFDDVSANVKDGVVTLTGKVTMPYKRERHREAGREGRRRAERCAIEITVLPVSQFDDELRYRIARSIYGNSNFWNYAIMANPPIHIVVEHGRVTLTGVVAEQRRPDAGAIAGDAVRRVVGDERAEDRRGGARVA